MNQLSKKLPRIVLVQGFPTRHFSGQFFSIKKRPAHNDTNDPTRQVKMAENNLRVIDDVWLAFVCDILPDMKLAGRRYMVTGANSNRAPTLQPYLPPMKVPPPLPPVKLALSAWSSWPGPTSWGGIGITTSFLNTWNSDQISRQTYLLFYLVNLLKENHEWTWWFGGEILARWLPCPGYCLWVVGLHFYLGGGLLVELWLTWLLDKGWVSYHGVNWSWRYWLSMVLDSGLGKEVAQYLASKDATVYLVCRSKERGQKALEVPPSCCLWSNIKSSQIKKKFISRKSFFC